MPVANSKQKMMYSPGENGIGRIHQKVPWENLEACIAFMGVHLGGGGGSDDQGRGMNEEINVR